MTTVRTRHVRRVALTVAACALPSLLTACGGHDGDGALPPANPYSTTPAASPSASMPAVTSPLTGLPVHGGRDRATRPAFGVGISGPDVSGLDDADIVYEEISDPVRYIAVYQSRDSDRIGPLGQGRSTDPQALGPLRAGLGYLSMRSGPHSQMSKMNVPDLGYPKHSGAYTSSGGHTYTSTKDMYSAIGKMHDKPRRPPEPFGFASDGKPLASTGLKKAAKLRVRVPGEGTQTWSYAKDRWTRGGAGPHVSVANVIIQHTTYKPTNIAHGGVTAPKAKVFGDGSVDVVSGGHAASGRWVRKAADSLMLYVDGDSFPFRFAPGRTWVLFAPPGTSVKVGS